MTVTLGFDVYGTLIDPHGIVLQLNELVGDKAPIFSQTWRNKQLEYSFRRGLMRDYADFAVCTRQALDYSDAVFNTDLNEDSKQMLMQCYQNLPAYTEVPTALAEIKAAGFRLCSFSNGTIEAVSSLLEQADIIQYFDMVVSVDTVKRYKPDPAVYQHFVASSGSEKSNIWLVSSNAFDILGAAGFGLQTAWLQQSAEAVFDPWGVEPTITVSKLSDLVLQIKAFAIRS